MLALLVPAVCGAEESSVYRWAGHGESLYDLADTGRVVEKPRYAESYPKNTRAMAENYRRLAEKNGAEPPYVYLMNSSKSADFDDPEKITPLWPLLQARLPGSGRRTCPQGMSFARWRGRNSGTRCRRCSWTTRNT